MSNLFLGWLSPDGNLVQCSPYEHIAVAHRLVELYKYKIDLLNKLPDDDILINNGWVHIGKSELNHKFVIWWNYRTFLTSSQKEFLEPYFVNKENVSDICYMNWEYDCDHR